MFVGRASACCMSSWQLKPHQRVPGRPSHPVHVSPGCMEPPLRAAVHARRKAFTSKNLACCTRRRPCPRQSDHGAAVGSFHVCGGCGRIGGNGNARRLGRAMPARLGPVWREAAMTSLRGVPWPPFTAKLVRIRQGLPMCNRDNVAAGRERTHENSGKVRILKFHGYSMDFFPSVLCKS